MPKNFTPEQRVLLEESFQRNPLPSRVETRYLARALRVNFGKVDFAQRGAISLNVCFRSATGLTRIASDWARLYRLRASQSIRASTAQVPLRLRKCLRIRPRKFPQIRPWSRQYNRHCQHRSRSTQQQPAPEQGVPEPIAMGEYLSTCSSREPFREQRHLGWAFTQRLIVLHSVSPPYFYDVLLGLNQTILNAELAILQSQNNFTARSILTRYP